MKIDHKLLDTKPAHPVKVGDWIKNGHLTGHKAGFFKDHLAGTFHHSTDGALDMPSDNIPVLKLLP